MGSFLPINLPSENLPTSLLSLENFCTINVLLGKKRRSKDIKSMSVCTYRKGNNNDNEKDSYDMTKTFVSGIKRDGREERDLAS